MTIAEKKKKQLSDPLPALEERSSAVDIQVRKACRSIWRSLFGPARLCWPWVLRAAAIVPYSELDLLLLFAATKQQPA